MNILQLTRTILQSFPKISAVMGTVHVEFADSNPDSYGLASIGDSLQREDILGNQVRKHDFLLYMTYSGINDYERLHNSEALLALCQWLPEQIGGTVESRLGGRICTGTVTKIAADNGMLYAVPQENCMDGLRYQMQITVTYTVMM
ncbi:MAG: hypothetical protein IJN57_06955 [Oscillospiraceae bacterium]|nr:hypothetical protein [Oscillospiraceae bacterium]